MSENTEQPKPESSPAPSAKEPAAPAQPVAQVKSDHSPAAQIKALWPSVRYVTEAAEKNVEQTHLARETAKKLPPPSKPDQKTGK